MPLFVVEWMLSQYVGNGLLLRYCDGDDAAVDFPSFFRDALMCNVSESCAAVVSSSLFDAAASAAPDGELINGIGGDAASGENNSSS